MSTFSETPWGELQELSREIAQEVRLRTDRANVPSDIAEVAARGRELGVSEAEMIEAIISTRPPEEPAPEPEEESAEPAEPETTTEATPEATPEEPAPTTEPPEPLPEPEHEDQDPTTP